MMIRHLPWIAFGLSLASLIGVAFVWSGKPAKNRPTLVVLVAPAVRVPVVAAAADFERESGIEVQFNVQASEALLTTLRIRRQGDLFLPADDSYVKKARELGLVQEEYPVASLTPVAVFRSDFPKQPADITWDDVFAPGIRLAQPNPATAVGKRTREGLTPSGLWRRIERSRPAMTGTVTEAANAVQLGSADAAIIWDGVAANYPQLRIVHLPHLNEISANVTAAVCTDAKAPAAARRFAKYLEREGQIRFRAAGYEPPRPQKKSPPCSTTVHGGPPNDGCRL